MPPNKTTADPAFDTENIEALFKKAKASGKPLPFAFGLGGKPQECGFLPHLRKEGRALKSILKSSSKKIKKVCFGTFMVDGNNILLSSEKPIKGMVRQFKVKLKEEKLGKFKPMLVDADGNEIDEDTLPEFTDDEEEDAAEAPAVQPSAAEQPAATDPSALTQRLAALRTKLEQAPDAPPKLKADFVAAVKLVQARDVAAATVAIDTLEKALSSLAPQKNAGNDKRVTAIFRDAKEAADQDINKLAEALRKHGEPALDRIAEHGLTVLKGGDTYAKMVAALVDFDKTSGREAEARALIPRVAAYRDAVMSDPMVAHWEKNPLVSLSIRAPMKSALDEITRTAEAAIPA